MQAVHVHQYGSKISSKNNNIFYILAGKNSFTLCNGRGQNGDHK